MFEGWINRMVTVVHSDCKKSFTGRVVSYSGESIILNDVFDTEGRPYRDYRTNRYLYQESDL